MGNSLCYCFYWCSSYLALCQNLIALNGNPIELNHSILEYYFNSWWQNANGSNKISRTQANYDALKEKLDTASGIIFVQTSSGSEQLAFLSSSAKAECDGDYIKNIQYWHKSGNGITQFTRDSLAS